MQNTLEKFNEFDSNKNDLIAVVGPCLDKKSYEVKTDFFKKFVDLNKNNDVFFSKIDNEKYTFDLRGFINKEIYDSNVSAIENIELDTFSKSEFFYSYRRSCVNKEKDYGRCISVIMMT